MNADKTQHEHDPQTYAIIGAAMMVHGELGHGFLESVYQEAFAIELSERGIPFQRELALPVRYKGHLLNSPFKADFICYEQIVVELKATNGLEDVHTAQVLNYLNATKYQRGLLLNFGTRSLQIKRIVRSCA